MNIKDGDTVNLTSTEIRNGSSIQSSESALSTLQENRGPLTTNLPFHRNESPTTATHNVSLISNYKENQLSSTSKQVTMMTNVLSSSNVTADGVTELTKLKSLKNLVPLNPVSKTSNKPKHEISAILRGISKKFMEESCGPVDEGGNLTENCETGNVIDISDPSTTIIPTTSYSNCDINFINDTDKNNVSTHLQSSSFIDKSLSVPHSVQNSFSFPVLKNSNVLKVNEVLIDKSHSHKVDQRLLSDQRLKEDRLKEPVNKLPIPLGSVVKKPVDIMMHKDKINILRQMSQIFNEEQPPEPTASSDSDEDDGHTLSDDILNTAPRIETATLPEVACSVPQVSESDSIRESMKINNEVNSQHLSEENCPIIQTDKEDALPEKDIEDESERISPLPLIADHDSKSKESTKAHSDLSYDSISSSNPNTDNEYDVEEGGKKVYYVPTEIRHDEPISVESYIGESGQSVDVIDGFTFMSYDNEDDAINDVNTKKNKKKQRGKKKRKTKRTSLRNKVATKSPSSELGLIKNTSEEVYDALGIDSFDELPSVDISDASDYPSFPTTPVPNEDEQYNAKDSDEGSFESISLKNAISPKSTTVTITTNKEQEKLLYDNNPKRNVNKQKINLKEHELSLENSVIGEKDLVVNNYENDNLNNVSRSIEDRILQTGYKEIEARSSDKNNEYEESNLQIVEDEVSNLPLDKHGHTISEPNAKQSSTKNVPLMSPVFASSNLDDYLSNQSTLNISYEVPKCKQTEAGCSNVDDDNVFIKPTQRSSIRSLASSSNSGNVNNNVHAEGSTSCSKDVLASTSFEPDHSDVLPTYDEISVDSILYPKEKYKYYYPDYNKEINSFGSSGEKSTKRPDVFVCRAGRLVPLSSVVKRNNKDESEKERVDLTYIYDEGKLLLLSGSMVNVDPSKTVPVHAMVVVPKQNGLKKLGIVRPLKDEFKSVYIDEKLANFALTALRKLHEIPQTSFRKFKGGFGKKSKTGYRYPHIPSSNSIVDKVSAKLDITPSSTIPISTQRNKLDNVGISSSTSSKGKILNYKNSNLYKKNMNRFPSLFREMKRLNMNFVDYEEMRKDDSGNLNGSSNSNECGSDSDSTTPCDKQSCVLGCVCSSLQCKPRAMVHCGKASCMFECECRHMNWSSTGGHNRANSRPIASLLNINRQQQQGLALKEKDFKWTIVNAGDGEVIMCGADKKRERKVPDRYRDNLYNSSIFADGEFSYPEAVMESEEETPRPVRSLSPPHPLEMEKIGIISSSLAHKHTKPCRVEVSWFSLPGMSIWCMVHNCYNCSCFKEPHSDDVTHSPKGVKSMKQSESTIIHYDTLKRSEDAWNDVRVRIKEDIEKKGVDSLVLDPKESLDRNDQNDIINERESIVAPRLENNINLKEPLLQHPSTNPEKIIDVLAECVLLEVCVWKTLKGKHSIIPSIHTLIKHWSHSNSHSARTAGYNRRDTCYRLIKDPLQQGFGYIKPINDCVSNATICNVKNGHVERYLDAIKNRDGSNKYESENSNAAYCANRGLPIVDVAEPPVSTPAVEELPALPKITSPRNVITNTSLKRTITVESCENGNKKIKLAPIIENSEIEAAKINNSKNTVNEKRLSKISLVKSPTGSHEPKSPVKNTNVSSDEVKHTKHSLLNQPNTLTEMIQEEEKRGELELDMSNTTPGGCLLVAEARFRKLINMNIIGVIGLNKVCRCIIAPVESSEMLAQMRKIQGMISNRSLDVGPNMREIFFPPHQLSVSQMKPRFVLIKCNKLQQWEIVGLVQKSDGKTSTSPIKTSLSIPISSAINTPLPSFVTSPTISPSKPKDNNILKSPNHIIVRAEEAMQKSTASVSNNTTTPVNKLNLSNCPTIGNSEDSVAESSSRSNDDSVINTSSVSDNISDGFSSSKPLNTSANSRKVITYRLGDGKNLKYPSVPNNPLSFSVSQLQTPKLKSPPPRIIKASDGRFLLVRSQTPGLRLARAPINFKLGSPSISPSNSSVPLVNVSEASVKSPIKKPLIVNEGAKPMKVVLLPSGSEPNKYFVVPSDSITRKKTSPILSAPVLKKTINLQALHTPTSSNSFITSQNPGKIGEHIISSKTDTSTKTVPSSVATASTVGIADTAHTDISTKSVNKTVENVPGVAVSGTAEANSDEAVQSLTLDKISYSNSSASDVPSSSDNTSLKIIIPSIRNKNVLNNCAVLPKSSTNSISPIKISTFSNSKKPTNCLSLKLKTISISQNNLPICSEIVKSTSTNSAIGVAETTDVPSISRTQSNNNTNIDSEIDLSNFSQSILPHHTNSSTPIKISSSLSSNSIIIPQLKRSSIPCTSSSSMDVSKTISSKLYITKTFENENSKIIKDNINSINGELEYGKKANMIGENSDPVRGESSNISNKSSLNKSALHYDLPATNCDNQKIQNECATSVAIGELFQYEKEEGLETSLMNDIWNRVKVNDSWTVVDMSLSFKSLKLSWLSGTIKKSILDRIFTMSQKDEEVVLFRVNNSKVNNASLYGFARPATTKNSDLLILASDADVVQDVSQLSLEAMFSNGRIKYFIELKKGGMGCYFYIDHETLSRIIPKKKKTDYPKYERRPVAHFRTRKQVTTSITAPSNNKSDVKTVESTCSCMKSGDFICMGHSTDEFTSVEGESAKEFIQENVNTKKNKILIKEKNNLSKSASVNVHVKTSNHVVEPSPELVPNKIFSRSSTDESIGSALNVQSPQIHKKNSINLPSSVCNVNENLSLATSSSPALSSSVTKFRASLAPSIASSLSPPCNFPGNVSDSSFHLQLSSDDESPELPEENPLKRSSDVYVPSMESEQTENAEVVDKTVENQSQCSSSTKSSLNEKKSDKGTKRKRSAFDRPCPASKKKLISSIEYDASFLEKDNSKENSVVESSFDISTETSVVEDRGTSDDGQTDYRCESENELIVDESVNSKSDESLATVNDVAETSNSTGKGKASGLKTHGSMFYGVMRYHKSKGKKNAQKKRKMQTLSGDSDASPSDKISLRKRRKIIVEKKDSSNESEADESSMFSSESVYDSCSTNDAESSNKFCETQSVPERHNNSIHNQMERLRRKEIGELFLHLQAKLRDFPESQAFDCRRSVWPKRATLEHAMKYISSLTSSAEELENRHKELLIQVQQKVKQLKGHLQRPDVPKSEKKKVQEMLSGIVYPSAAKVPLFKRKS